MHLVEDGLHCTGVSVTLRLLRNICESDLKVAWSKNDFIGNLSVLQSSGQLQNFNSWESKMFPGAKVTMVMMGRIPWFDI